MNRRGAHPAGNAVWIDEADIIRLVQKGPQNGESVARQRQQAELLIAKQREAGKKALLLVDLTSVRKTDTGARLEAKGFLEADFDALAVIGNRYLQPIIAFVLRSVGKGHKVHYFSSERAALGWLHDSRRMSQQQRMADMRRSDPLKQGRAVRWAIIPLFLLTIVGSFVAWQQARLRLESDAQASFSAETNKIGARLDERLLIYTQALYGYRGLFHSSDRVDEKEFADYSLAQTHSSYPGINAISFIATVPAAKLSAFLQTVRSDKSLNAAGNPDFKIIPSGSREEYFPITYIVGDNAGKGVDLRENAERRKTMEAARDSGKPMATNSVQLLDKQGNPEPNRGFLIAMPVYQDLVPTTVEARRAQNEGFINAVFDYNILLSETFAKDVSSNVHLEVLDAGNQKVYTQGPKNEAYRQSTLHVDVAGRDWAITITAPRLYGVSDSEAKLPRAILSSGILVAALLAIIFWLQNRARQQAVSLAEAMTEDLQLERNLAVATKGKDEAILSSIGDAVFAIDKDEKIILFNAAAERISGFTAKEAVGKPYGDVLTFVLEETGKPSTHFIARAASGHASSMQNHTLLIRKNGDRMPVADSAAPIRDAEGKQIGVIVVFRDISKEYALDKAKSEFVSLASHQLRTPLTAIGWNTELLLGGDTGKIAAKQRERIEEIKNGTRRMVELVNSLLDVSRLDLGKLANEPTPNSMAELIKSLHQELEGSIAAKSLVITETIDKKTPNVMADPKLLRMIVQNLFSNAVKYTAPKGIIELTLHPATKAEMERATLKEDVPSIFLSVADNGYGIPKAQQDRVFSKLFRADNARTMAVEGTGLGLYIVQQVAVKLGGNVWFESTESIGTTFNVVLPVTTKAWTKKEPKART